MQQVTYKGNPADLSAETLQARREWQDIFKVLKEKTTERKNYNQDYSTWQGSHSKLMEKLKAFRKQKLREFSTTKPALQQMLNGLI